MEMRRLTPRYYVSPQIAAEDMPALRDAGITRILCNRPDAEVPPSQQAAAIRAAATEAGIGFAEVPLTHQTMVPDVIARNRAEGVETNETVLAYCASGTRSTIAWALGQAGQLPADDIVASARAAGYDLENLRPMLGASFTAD
ncbi:MULTISPECIES: TIGR01244 family sulfur transferase [unclassified Sulfitobacter]|uniref:TIGR01244 family sulfur transferase n=1 Tax=unclassified Sulfitobacter TaxID=196795 RepID=UPI0007C38BCF|nr:MULTISPECIES: TIGR01244 family sulfur transferase [unclassified Sulfitobacter]KZY06240.1 TIGR01244 family protein [Sulfitobacter sp. HI0023]KZY27024.1 TIGR01244 family protein [Sulfitobacter sp. HI0040]KZZ69422.1 TIGR01244 family protein [Sulfitobacter sp. HI0129]